MIKKIILLFTIAIFHNFNAFAQAEIKTIFKPIQNKFPIELELILGFIQSASLSEIQKNQFGTSIVAIDRYARNLTDEELLFVTKTEVYKTFLRPTDTELFKKEYFNPQYLAIIRNTKKNANVEPFVKWFLSAIENDLSTLFSSSEYKDLMLLKSSGKQIPIELLKIERRLELVLRLAIKINPDNLAELNQELMAKSLSYLKNLENSFQLLCLYSKNQPLTNDVSLKNLKFFTTTTMVATRSAQPTDPTEKSIEDIFSPKARGIPAPQIPTPVGDDEWLNDSELNKLFAPTNENLPKPTGETDWLPDF